MRSSRFGFLAVVLLPLTGCGTLSNLNDPPQGPMFVGTGCCYPFGGVVRSGLLAVMGPPMGLAQVAYGNVSICQGEVNTGFQHIGNGLLLSSAGVVAIADAPLSLAGDVLTFPVAYARSNEYPWATWWGEKSRHLLPPPAAPPPVENKQVSVERTGDGSSPP